MDGPLDLLRVKLRCAGIIPKRVWDWNRRFFVQFQTTQDMMEFVQYVPEEHKEVLFFGAPYQIPLDNIDLKEFASLKNVDRARYVVMNIPSDIIEDLETPLGAMLPTIPEHPTFDTIMRQTSAFREADDDIKDIRDSRKIVKALTFEFPKAMKSERMKSERMRVITLMFEMLVVDRVSDLWRKNPPLMQALWRNATEAREFMSSDDRQESLALMSSANAMLAAIVQWAYKGASTLTIVLGRDVMSIIVGFLVTPGKTEGTLG